MILSVEKRLAMDLAESLIQKKKYVNDDVAMSFIDNALEKMKGVIVQLHCYELFLNDFIKRRDNQTNNIVVKK